jgi:hypothetical protein
MRGEMVVKMGWARRLRQRLTGLSLLAVRVSIPFTSVRIGDVINLDGRGQLVVVTDVGIDRDGNDAIRFMSADGQRYLWRCPVGIAPQMYARVGLDCEPTLAGLRAFIAQRPQ